MVEVFQSPIGTQKTIDIVDRWYEFFLVSIPYRYTKNLNENKPNKPLYFCFNPLQVHKKPPDLIVSGNDVEAFQSPIGTQKTRPYIRRAKLNIMVSIPYRYTKNLSQLSYAKTLYAFQSPIGTQKTPLWFVVVDRISRFQSPIGTQKTSDVCVDYHESQVFQSPIGTQKTFG